MGWGFPGGVVGKESTCLPMQETQELRVPSLGQEDSLEEEMATHSRILAWRIPWSEEPGGLQSMGSQSQTGLKRLGIACTFLHTHATFFVTVYSFLRSCVRVCITLVSVCFASLFSSVCSPHIGIFSCFSFFYLLE